MALWDVGHEVDQVVRRERFEAAHPDVVIRPPGKHSMLYVAEVPGVGEVTSFDLRSLLDKLDQLVA